MSKSLLLIENAASGQQPTQLDAFKHEIKALNWKIEQRSFDPRQENTPSMNSLLEDLESFDGVIGVGGDGTISSLADALKGKAIPLFIYPGGTGNLIAQNLYTQLDVPYLCHILESWHYEAFDLGCIRSMSEERSFLMLAGAGTDAEMIRESEGLKPTLGILAYIAALVQQMDRTPVNLNLSIDGKKINEPKAVAVMVANLGKLNFRLPLVKAINPQDQLLDVIVIREFNWGIFAQSVLQTLQEFLSEESVERPQFGLYRGKVIDVHCDVALSLQQDGELMKSKTPVSFMLQKEKVLLFYDQDAL